MFLKITNELTNKFYIKIFYIFIGLSFATVISDFPYFNLLNTLALGISFIYVIINIFDLLFFKHRKIYIFEIFLYLFLILSLYLNFKYYNIIDNLKVWLINLMIMTVIFSIDTYKDKKKLLFEINFISYFYTIFTFILSLISLFMIFTNRSIISNSISYDGLFKNENSFGIAAIISLMISLYLIFNSFNKYFKIFLISNVFIQGVSIFVSHARSAYFPLLALIFIFLVYKFKSIYFRISLILLPAFISIIGFFTLPSNILHKILTSREYLWKTAIKLIEVYPLTGVGNVNKVGRLQDHRVAYLQGLELGGLHNIFFEIATVNGLICMVLFLLFIIGIIVFFIKRLEKLNSQDKLKYSFLFSLVFGIIFINLLESSLVYIISFISIIFWIYSGYLISILEKNHKS